MKRLLKDTKLRNALLLSTLLHFILILIWGVTQVHPPIGEVELSIQVEIDRDRPKPPLRPLKRPLYIPRVPTVAEEKSRQLTARRFPLVHQIDPPGRTMPRNSTSEVPPSMLNENSLPPTTTRDTVGKARTFPAAPGAYQGLIASGVGSPLGGQAVGTQRFLNIDNQEISPDIAGLTQPDLALAKIAHHILSTRTTDKMDIVFVVDASQSMRNDINAVRDHLSQMTDLFDAENLDFTVGVVAFRESTGFALLGWNFEITPQTNSISQIKKVLSEIKCRGGEKALNALVRAAREVKFRNGAEKRFILVTDEYVSGKYSAKEVLTQIQEVHIHIDVIGLDEYLQKFIAQRTGGMWLPISSLKD